MLKLNLNLFWRRTYVKSVIFFIVAKFGRTFHIAIIFVYNDDASTKTKMFANEKRKLDR